MKRMKLDASVIALEKEYRRISWQSEGTLIEVVKRPYSNATVGCGLRLVHSGGYINHWQKAWRRNRVHPAGKPR